MITEKSICETRKELEVICKDWHKDSDEYKTLMTASIYLREFERFLVYVKGTDAARMYGDFIIECETYDSDEW